MALDWQTMDEAVRPWVGPATVMGIGLVVGVIIERLLRARLFAWAHREHHANGEVVLAAVRGVIVLWSLLIAAAIAARNAPLSEVNSDLLATKIVPVLWVLSATLVASRIATAVFRLHADKLHAGSASLVANIIGIAIAILGLLVACQTIGLEITPILTALGVGGLAVALALQDTLSNLFAGIHILVSRHVRPGNFVRLDTGDEGHVIDIGWRNTTVRSLGNNLIIVPNSKLASAVVTNFSLPEKLLMARIDVGVAYGSDLERVEAVALEVANWVLAEPVRGDEAKPFVRFTAFGDSAITLGIWIPVEAPGGQQLATHACIKALHARFQAEGIEIPYPIRTVRIERGDAPAEAAPVPAQAPTAG